MCGFLSSKISLLRLHFQETTRFWLSNVNLLGIVLFNPPFTHVFDRTAIAVSYGSDSTATVIKHLTAAKKNCASGRQHNQQNKNPGF
jgi:hypothetical protein